MEAPYMHTNPKPLNFYSALSFDVYATLIDWETGIFEALQPLNTRVPLDSGMRDNRSRLLGLFTQFEGELQSKHPEKKYSEILELVYSKIAQTILPANQVATIPESEISMFGKSVGHWPAFPDTVASLKRLSKRYKLIVLSNVDRRSFQGTLENALQGVNFDAVYTAEEIQSYKPDPRNFSYLIDHTNSDFGIPEECLLHTAQALKHDLFPAKKAGLASCWIRRGSDAAIGGRLQDFDKADLELSYVFNTLGDMVKAVEEAFLEEKSK